MACRQKPKDKPMEKSNTIIAGCGRLGASIAGKMVVLEGMMLSLYNLNTMLKILIQTLKEKRIIKMV